MQITRALKGKGIKYISRIFMMRIIMRQFPGMSSLRSSRVCCPTLQAGGGRHKINKIRAMGGIFKRDNEIWAKAGGTPLRSSINNIWSSRLEGVPVMDIRGGLGCRVCLLKINVMNGSIISKPTSNSIEAVPNRIVKQVLAVQSIAVHKMEAEWVGRGSVARALKDSEDGT